ncbi:MAG: C25 family cysteine peptidase [Euryarchaeota archaeon]|nr:C25 family cysteine peptidase [Euryarchaeota archaeon]
MSIQEEIQFSEPVITDQNNYLSVQIKEATSYAALPGNPVLPVFTKLFTFPFGTIIKDVSFATSSVQVKELTKEILPAVQPTPVSGALLKPSNEKQVKNDLVYLGMNTYPLSRLDYQVGAGLNGNDHVILLSVQYYPLLYLPHQHTLLYTPSVQITVTYEQTKNLSSLPADNKLLIIAPEEYTAALQPLVVHKNKYNIVTSLMTTEWIAIHSTGRDLPEQIKYAIKDAIETNSISSVMLVGGVEKIPIRRSYVSLWGFEDDGMITDLYYSDIHDAYGNFSSWDTNNNDKFGESSDRIDLYPDVHLGRLACDSVQEVSIAVDKIIHYETETYGSDWFNTMVFIGGNTFRWSPGNDGEENNVILMGIMSQFTPKIIWTSKGNFNRQTISNAITDGAGFLDYSGHGFEHGMGTFTPSGLQMKYYFTAYIEDQKNEYKLPIIFFDACLTAKIDYVLQDTLDYSKIKNIVTFLVKALGVNTSQRIPCYAWAFLKQEGGGAIATIGATRTAYGGIDSGAGKMSIEFFSAYNSSEYLGQMMTQMQNGYITDVHDDEFTVEEFMLLGDPTLKIGGYPAQ